MYSQQSRTYTGLYNDGLFTAQKRKLLSHSNFYDYLRQISQSRKLFFITLRKVTKFDKEFLFYLENRTNWQKLKSDFGYRYSTARPQKKPSSQQPSTMKSLIHICIVAFIGSILLGFCRPHGLHEAEDKDHLKSHLHGSVDDSHLDAMSVEELRFNYFKAHDADGNSKLDGCELTQAFVDYHAEEISSDPKMFSDKEIELVIDQILGAEDRNSDGYVDYTEFVASQERLDAHH